MRHLLFHPRDELDLDESGRFRIPLHFVLRFLERWREISRWESVRSLTAWLEEGSTSRQDEIVVPPDHDERFRYVVDAAIQEGTATIECTRCSAAIAPGAVTSRPYDDTAPLFGPDHLMGSDGHEWFCPRAHLLLRIVDRIY